MPHLHPTTLRFLIGVGAFLTLASSVGAILAWTLRGERARATVANLNARIRSWWVMVGLVVGAGLAGIGAACILFGLVSFLALREFVTLSPTRRGDHRTLFWLFFIVVPAQFWLVWDGWYGLASIFVPVWVFLFIAARSVAAGDTSDYLARVARIHVATMICVYFVSHAPLLLQLSTPEHPARGLDLLLYLIAVSQLSDVFQYVWGKLCGRRPVAPTISPNKTWEGLVGGGLSAVAVGTGLWWMTPFLWWQSALFAAVIVFCGFIGGLVMSAIKRDAGVKDWGHLIPGHGGIVDRIDSLAFAAPAFFHLLRYYLL